ncbi:hypothetical protein NMY22_g8999 [Coprinellus aureogranulatus]|nr:hypothetical protein NMY22_g8999 [Coprinellus aureogranulatus]
MKKDRDNPANYRPITVLCLASVAPSIIHPDQAGFMTGRRIDDQTELIKLMVKWCEAKNKRGLLVFLDQEKAYDRISHNFLFESMEKYRLPAHFVNCVKHLYCKAEAVVIVNGVISDSFRVTCSVCQGNPLSCLLLNIAIKSLANLLHKSALQGFSLPGHEERLIVSMFVDDTTVYLLEKDNFTDLQTILAKWFSASGAKFNVHKTEAIPIGPRPFRNQVISKRLLHRNNPVSRIPKDIKIAEEGVAI